MKEFNQEELKKISEAINLYQTGVIDGGEDVEDYIAVRTAETTDDYKVGNRWKDIKRNAETGDGWTADLIESYQYVKGDSRVNLLIIDLGESRAVVEF